MKWHTCQFRANLPFSATLVCSSYKNSLCFSSKDDQSHNAYHNFFYLRSSTKGNSSEVEIRISHALQAFQNVFWRSLDCNCRRRRILKRVFSVREPYFHDCSPAVKPWSWAHEEAAVWKMIIALLHRNWIDFNVCNCNSDESKTEDQPQHSIKRTVVVCPTKISKASDRACRKEVWVNLIACSFDIQVLSTLSWQKQAKAWKIWRHLSHYRLSSQSLTYNTTREMVLISDLRRSRSLTLRSYQYWPARIQESKPQLRCHEHTPTTGLVNFSCATCMILVKQIEIEAPMNIEGKWGRFEDWK